MTKLDRAPAPTGITSLIQKDQGVLNYIANVARPDCSKAACMHGQVAACPKRDVEQHFKHTWMYLNATAHYKLQHKLGLPNQGQLEMIDLC